MLKKETDVYIVYQCNVKTEYILHICGALPLTSAFAVKIIRNTDAFDLIFIHIISSKTAVADLLLSTN